MSTTTDALLAEYQVDTAHARRVADLSLTLFDGTMRLHKLSSGARRLLEIGALLHNLGLQINESKHHTVGRDIVLNTELEQLNDDDRALVACLVAFHRKKVRPQLESAYLRLDKRDQERALRLAAILRIADGLDASQSQSTRIERLSVEDAQLQLGLSGPHAASDGTRATEKADLWCKLFDHEVVVEVVLSSAQEELPLNGNGHQLQAPPSSAEASATPTLEVPHVVADPSPPGQLQPSDTLVDAARKLLRRYFQKLLLHEAEVLKGNDIEGVHQMRVATRRLRATLQALAPAVGLEQAQRFRRQLRAVARALGKVRDRDVFLAHVEQYCSALDEAQCKGMSPLIAALRRDQAAARQQLLRRFQTRRYARFKRDCATFLTASDTPSDEERAAPTPRIRYAAGSAIWRGYEELRAYETLLPMQGGMAANTDMELLHEMRIAGKHFRYTLELFGDALGPRVDQALEPLLTLQEHLGALQDIEVAVPYVQRLAGDHAVALDTYVQSRHADHDRLLSELPRCWEKVASATYRRRLLDLIVKL